MELENTYFIYNKNEKEEAQRLINQDRLLTRALKETLPEGVHDVLDVACGTGGWVIEMAKQYPAVRFTGIDISSKMVEQALHQAKEEQVDDRVEFFVMDVLRSLEFPAESFDLIHMRLGMSFLRTWDWEKLLHEFQRATRWNGTIRVIESDFISTPDPAFSQLVAWAVQAMHHAGHLFFESRDGLTRELPKVFSRFGIKNVKSTEYVFEYTSQDTALYEDMRSFYRMFIPFLRKWTRFPTNYDEIYEQAMWGMQQESFTASWRFVTVEGSVN
jgi:ubiquinone/menaquinone biosynthesis C-methylase UbiE